MSFGGGAGGFSFGNSATASSGQGNQPAKAPFSFGGNPQQTTSTPTGGFSFGGSAGGQTVGSSSTNSQQSGTPGNAFSFGNTNSATGGASGGLFGAAANGSATPASKSALSFGPTTGDTASTTNNSSTTPASAPPANLLGGFGKPAGVNTAAGGSGSLFGQAKSAESTTTAPPSTFTGFGSGAAKPTGGFSFGTPSAPPTTAANNMNSSAANTTSASNTVPSASKSAGFIFNTSTGSATSAPGTGFSLGAPKPSDGASATPASSAPSGGSAPSFSFGGASTSGTAANVKESPATNSPASSFTLVAGSKTDNKDKTTTSKEEGAKPSTPTFPNFGAASTASNNAQTSATTHPAPGGGLFASKPTSSTSAGIGSSTAPTSNLFAGFGKSNAPTEAAKSPGATTEATGTVPATAPTAPLSGFSMPASVAPASAAIGKPSTAPVSLPPPSMLRGRNLEEIVNKWSMELENATKEFTRQAAEVAVWDSVLRRGGDEISRLLQVLQIAEERQSSIEQTLDYVEQQQADLTSLLDSYESQVGELVQGATMGALNAYGSSGMTRSMETGAADAERERAYSMAESLNAQLDELSRNLGSMIVEVNKLSSSTAASRAQAEPDANSLGPLRSGNKLHNAGADPVSQIVAILNAHLGSLKWIDENTIALREKVENLRRGQIGGEGRLSTRGGIGERVSASPTSHRREGSINATRNRQSSVGPGDPIRGGSVGPGYSRVASVGRNAGQGWSEANIASGGGSNLGRSRGYGL